MPIQFPDFNRISFDEANPLLTGMSRGQQLMQNFMQFPQELRAKMLANQIAQVQAQYAQPMAEQGLLQAKQKTEYDPKIWESEIGLRGAQTGLTNQQSKYYAPNIQSEIALRQAQTQGVPSEIALRQAQAQQAQQEANITQMKGNYFKNRLMGNSSQGNMPAGQSSQQQGMGGGQPTSMGMAGSPQAPINNTYGVEVPKPSDDDIANKLFFSIDTYTPKQTQAIQNVTKQKDAYIKQISEGVAAANQAQKARQALMNYNVAMDKAHLTGPYWGTTPVSGWRTAFHPFDDLTNDQIAENSVANILPGAMAEIKSAMGEGKFGVIDMQASQKMKVDRTLTKGARTNISGFMNGVFSRMDEMPKFYQSLYAAKNVDKQTADLLWQNYQNAFPISNGEGGLEQDNLNNWPLYTTPKAIASVQSTGTYKPTAGEKNIFMMNVPDKNGVYHVMPVKKGKIETFFRKGAKPL